MSLSNELQTWHEFRQASPHLAYLDEAWWSDIQIGEYFSFEPSTTELAKIFKKIGPVTYQSTDMAWTQHGHHHRGRHRISSDANPEVYTVSEAIYTMAVKKENQLRKEWSKSDLSWYDFKKANQ